MKNTRNFHNQPKGNSKNQMEKSMKQNESKNFNILHVLQMTTTLESNKSFVVTFRRYQLNANTHDIAKSINIYIAKKLKQ